MSQQELDHKLSHHRLVPVVKVNSASQAMPLAESLVYGGLPVAEITLRTDCALEAIAAVAAMPDMLVGAGTVLNAEQAKQARDAGARFVVSPGLDSGVVEFCLENGLPVYPGVATPSEVQRAFNMGLRSVKFFPAEVNGGVPALKALAGPFHQMKFVPTGGVNAKNVGEYLDLDCTLAVGGSWMVKPDLFSDGNFEPVIAQTRQAVATAKNHN